MKQGLPSITARIASFLRAAHQALPKDERISQDPHSIDMLQAGLTRWLAKWPRFGRMLDRWRPGIIDLISTRDRFADEHAKATLGNGGQLVMLGAGLDTMPWRLEGLDSSVVIYEIDFPATQEYRKSMIAKGRIGAPPQEIIRVALDFESESLINTLLEGGLRSDIPSLINWMGVIYYLDEETITQVLRDVRQMTNQQSIMVFDFFQPPQKSEKVPKSFRRSGEPLKFFIDAKDFPEFARKNNFEVVELISLDDLAFRYSGRRRSTDTPVFAAAIRPLSD